MINIHASSSIQADSTCTLVISDLKRPSVAHVASELSHALEQATHGSFTHPTRLWVSGLGFESVIILPENATESSRAIRENIGASFLLPHLSSRVIVDADLEEELFSSAIEGAFLGAYRFNEYKSSSEEGPSEAIFVTNNPHAQEVIEKMSIFAHAQYLVRDWVNTPSADLRTRELAEQARSAMDATGVHVRIWGEKELEENSCGGLLGVGAGSTSPSQLVRLEWAPEGATRHVALVGKGITFDSGGMSLKTHGGLIDMKTDMTGAATVAATVWAAAKLNLPVRVTGWMCIAENMLSGSATRVGDVLRMPDGQTVEVTNTDAEGRLVLADGLSLAIRENPDEVIDLATLTGAQIVALGERTAGLMGNAHVHDELFEASLQAGEDMWPMPLPEHLEAGLTSPIADMVNSNMKSRQGGMLFAGLFLQKFVGDTPWAHIDIAGPAYNTGKAWGSTPQGATGFAVRTLLTHLGA